jgi:hypothetical protein
MALSGYKKSTQKKKRGGTEEIKGSDLYSNLDRENTHRGENTQRDQDILNRD